MAIEMGTLERTTAYGKMYRGFSAWPAGKQGDSNRTAEHLQMPDLKWTPVARARSDNLHLLAGVSIRIMMVRNESEKHTSSAYRKQESIESMLPITEI
ncbi:PTS system, cellobiose-specific IIA component [Anopheles sinensis]|uniref:PTS system, cellobiose-specific IIA component n=1 Tax=Anopheles sinensis TaxID=74873 RepID=A0A084WBX0_ANOSI|nr:PTS system, cellobiose-specific IIA component [Anopheles sinensis]